MAGVQAQKHRQRRSLVLSLKTVYIATYTFIRKGRRTNGSGPVLPLCSFFVPRVPEVYLLEQPLPGSDHLRACLTRFQDGLMVHQCRMRPTLQLGTSCRRFDSNRTYLRLKARDVLSNAWALMRAIRSWRRTRIDLFIGVEAINTIWGIVLKRLGLVRRVVYYVFDWAPDRYRSRLMNRLYLWLDKMAVYHSDGTWNITYAIGDARRELLGYRVHRMSRQIYVPYSPGLAPFQVPAGCSTNTNLVVYAGGLIPENGPDLLLKAFRRVVQQFPAARLWIIGDGELEADLKAYIRKWHLQHAVTLLGYVADEKELWALQLQGAIGAAPYPAIKGSRKPFGDVIKIRVYFSAGLATVTTPVPPVAREIQAERLGIVTADDSPEAFAAGLLELLQDKAKLARYRQNCIEKAKQSTWQRAYTSALHQMGLKVPESIPRPTTAQQPFPLEIRGAT